MNISAEILSIVVKYADDNTPLYNIRAMVAELEGVFQKCATDADAWRRAINRLKDEHVRQKCVDILWALPAVEFRALKAHLSNMNGGELKDLRRQSDNKSVSAVRFIRDNVPGLTLVQAVGVADWYWAVTFSNDFD